MIVLLITGTVIGVLLKNYYDTRKIECVLNVSKDNLKPSSRASLSNKRKHIDVKDSGHFIQTDHLDVVINAIKEMINEVKK